MELVVVLLLALVLGWFVSAPFRRAGEAEAKEAGERDELEAARDQKLREIRELELDHRTGKVADEDYKVIDRRLRNEAVDLLHRLDELK